MHQRTLGRVESATEAPRISAGTGFYLNHRPNISDLSAIYAGYPGDSNMELGNMELGAFQCSAEYR